MILRSSYLLLLLRDAERENLQAFACMYVCVCACTLAM